MKRYVPLVILAALMICPAAKSQKAPTLEQFLSAPFPTELTPAPAKGRVAWVFNANGARNLWIAEPAPDGSYKSRQITSYKDDDGQDLGMLSWAPDAETIVYTRGGDLEFANASYPNPQNSPQGVEQNIWAVSFNGGASELRWSPDGSKLAFASRRGDHGFIGVYDVAAKSLIYLEPSVDTDLEAAWSPDSRRIAFVRIAVAKGRLPFSPDREGQPWSIRIADATTGKGQEIWHADAGSGSVFHEVVAENQLIWAAGDRIVFPWERGGWIHLWSAPVSGGAAKPLTPGNFEVEYVAASSNGQTIVFSSNQDDIDRRHVWKVSSTGDHPEAVTSGAGIETAPVLASDDKTVLVLRSDAHTTMRPALVAGKGEIRDLAPESLPADFPASAMVTPQQVILSGVDGMQIHAQLFLPRNAGDGARHPALCFFHGGSRRQMLLGFHYRYYYSNDYAMNQYLASRGYIVLSVNYRSGIGYGRAFREAPGRAGRGATEYRDVVAAGKFLQSRPDVDPARVGLWGGSYGGFLTAMGLAHNSDIFAAGVDFHGVHDWPTDNWDGKNIAPELTKLAHQSSPVSGVDTWKSPVLFIHGDDDRNVYFTQTVDLVARLRARGVHIEQLIFPDEIHDFLLHRTWLAGYHAESDFFDRQLKNRASTTGAKPQ
jgi:dipeptidyl aminopeptidase/acylaminoacyl peptidase